jgi:hypothetical protein
MIDVVKLETVLVAMETAIGISGYESEHVFDKPVLPYFTYKITLDDEDEKYQEIRVEEEITDPTVYPETVSRFGEAVISLNFFGNDGKDLRAKMKVAKEFLEETPLWDDMTPYEFTGIQDRSTFLETDWEKRLGFDVKISNVNSKSVTTPAIDIPATIPTIELEIL